MWPQSLLARNADPYSLSAALTLRIAKFITWPDRPSIATDRPYFIIGVMGNAHTQKAFAEYAGRSLKGLKLKNFKIDTSTDPHILRRCHVVFVDSSASPDVVEGMIGKSKGILTVHGPGSKSAHGACLRLTAQSGKMAFDIDLVRTRKAKLQVDAGVINLARSVNR